MCKRESKSRVKSAKLKGIAAQGVVSVVKRNLVLFMARAAKPGRQPAGGAKAQSLEWSNALAQMHESNQEVLAEAKSHAENTIAEFYQNNNLSPQTPEQRYCVPQGAPTKVCDAAAFLNTLSELERLIAQSPECQRAAILAMRAGVQAIELCQFKITNKPHDQVLKALQQRLEGSRRGGKCEPVWQPAL